MSIQMTGADVIDMAVQTEIRGERFYGEAAARASSDAARRLFAFLAAEETRHRQTFEGMSSDIVAADVDPTTWAEAIAYIDAAVDRAFFSSPHAPIQQIAQGASEEDMLRQAIAFERDTLLFFVSLRDLVQPANQPLVDEIAREERRHIAQLGHMLSEARRAGAPS